METTKKHYSAEIQHPNNLKEGLQNFVQIIINDIESNKPQNALFTAVDLLNDLRFGTYNDACKDIPKEVETTKTISLLSNQIKKLEVSVKENYNQGLIDGNKQAKLDIKEALGL